MVVVQLVDSPVVEDEASLVAQARRDRHAFARLYRQYLPQVYRYCYHRLGSQEAAEDATSQIFAQVLAALPHYQTKERLMATFVIVPGAWSGAWVWQWLASALRDAGHQVHPVALSGLGERVDLAHPGIDLTTHSTDVVTALEFADLRDVVLVGGSYAGMIITGVADRVPERLAQMIYLDATVAEDGQSLYDAWPDGAASQASDLQEAEIAGTPGFLPPLLGWIEAAVPDAPVRAVMLERLTPHPLATWAQPIRIGEPDRLQVPHAYLHQPRRGVKSQG